MVMFKIELLYKSIVRYSLSALIAYGLLSSSAFGMSSDPVKILLNQRRSELIAKTERMQKKYTDSYIKSLSSEKANKLALKTSKLLAELEQVRDLEQQYDEALKFNDMQAEHLNELAKKENERIKNEESLGFQFGQYVKSAILSQVALALVKAAFDGLSSVPFKQVLFGPAQDGARSKVSGSSVPRASTIGANGESILTHVPRIHPITPLNAIPTLLDATQSVYKYLIDRNAKK